MNPTGLAPQPNESVDLSRYQQAADLAYQYAKKRAQKDQGPEGLESKNNKDQQEE